MNQSNRENVKCKTYCHNRYFHLTGKKVEFLHSLKTFESNVILSYLRKGYVTGDPCLKLTRCGHIAHFKNFLSTKDQNNYNQKEL